MSITVAIVGSGPAGFYAAEALLKTCDCRQIDIIEQLPTPYGLIRGGVAPDHESTRNVAKKYERTAMADEVCYYGNVEINRDVSLDELRELYDAVILAIGAPNDRVLTIPGADKHGVFGAAAFVGWYNGHPNFHQLDPDLNVAAVAVIGIGNVAIDVARMLVRSRQVLEATDVPAYARDKIAAAPITDIYLFGRRGPVEAKFTQVELRELGQLDQAAALARAEQLPEDLEAVLAGYEGRERRLLERNLATLREYATVRPDATPKRISFEFFAQPVEVLGGERVEGLRLERTRVVDGRAEGTGEIFDVSCGLIVTAIGYRADPLDGAPYDAKSGIIPNDDGRVDDGLYAVGWIKRGPSGVISSSRPDGQTVARYIHDDFAAARSGKPGRAGLEKLLKERGIRYVTFEDWKKLEALEISSAEHGAPRRKFVSVEEMMKALDQ